MFCDDSFCVLRLTKDVTLSPSSQSSKSRKSRVPTTSDSDSDGELSSEHEGTPFPNNPSHQTPLPYQTPHCSPPDTSIDRLKTTSDRISKEKQKFFRLSAFNADKKKDKKKVASLPVNNAASRTTRHNVKKAAEERVCKRTTTKEQSDASTSSSSECSSSSDDDDDSDSDSSESDSDSSTNPSEPLRANNHPLKIPTLFTMNSNKTYTFGSISGLNVNNDGMWGFAAAAAQVQKKDEPVSFAALAKSNNVTAGEKSANDDKVSGQVKGLFDGLSHLYAAPNETRSRSSSSAAPNYNPTRRKRPESQTNSESEDAKKLKSQVLPSSARLPSTHTLPPTVTVTRETIDYTQMTPSNLVKTAVNCKRHEFERRKFLKTDLGSGGFAHSAILEDAHMKKRNLIAEATQTNHPVLSIANNQTGKIGAPNLYIRTFPIPISPPPTAFITSSVSFLNCLARGDKPGDLPGNAGTRTKHLCVQWSICTGFHFSDKKKEHAVLNCR